MKFDENTVSGIVEKVAKPLATSPEELADDLEEAAELLEMWRVLYDAPPSASKTRKSLEEIGKHAGRLAKALGVVEGKDIRHTQPYLYSALTRQAGIYAEREAVQWTKRAKPLQEQLRELQRELYEASSNKERDKLRHKLRRPFREARRELRELGDPHPFPGLKPTPYQSDSGEKVIDYGEAEAVLRAAEGAGLLHVLAKTALEEMQEPDYEDWPPGGPSAEAWLIGEKLPEVYEQHFAAQFGRSRFPKGGPPYGPGLRFAKAVLDVLGIPKSEEAITKTWQRNRR